MDPITSRTDWTIPLLEEVWKHIEDIAKNDLGLTYFQPQIEIVSAEQMLDAYASNGYPLNYHHWSFGKSFLRDKKKYESGDMACAYEMCICTNPSIAYCMEENDAVTQALVLAHASCGHNFVFKNNYLFQEADQSKTLIDYLTYARDYIRECEEKFGEKNVEHILDIAHALANNSIDRRPRKSARKTTVEEMQNDALAKSDDEQRNLDIVIKTTSSRQEDLDDKVIKPKEDNLLYFIAEKSPILEPWQREVLHIVRQISQSFYPNRLTKLIHEGFATFTHVYIMNELEKRGVISPDAQMSWIHTHSNVVFQPDMHSKYYDCSVNPYALGLDIFKDIRRICEDPTDEDKLWFPELIGKPWREEIKKAASNYNDESFIAQFLSPTLIRKYKMMLVNLAEKNEGVVTDISDDVGYRNIRGQLSSQYNIINYTPNIMVSCPEADDRTLVIEYIPFNNRELYRHYSNEIVNMIKDVWGPDVVTRNFDPLTPRGDPSSDVMDMIN